MKISLLLLSYILFHTSLWAVSPAKKELKKWKSNQSELIHIFLVTDERNKVEILRLYKDSKYEFLHYQYGRNSEAVVHCASGSYSLKNQLLKLECKNVDGSKSKVYHDEWYFYKTNHGLTRNIFKYLFNKRKLDIKEVHDSMYKLPFYLSPRNGDVVHNV